MPIVLQKYHRTDLFLSDFFLVLISVLAQHVRPPGPLLFRCPSTIIAIKNARHCSVSRIPLHIAQADTDTTYVLCAEDSHGTNATILQRSVRPLDTVASACGGGAPP